MAEYQGGLAIGGTAIGVSIIVQNEEAKQKFEETMQSGQRLTMTLGNVGKAAGQIQTPFQALGTVLGTISRIFTQTSISIFVFGIIYRRLAMTARQVSQAQENVNEAVRKYGRYSKEAKDAIENLEYAQENATMAQIQFGMQAVLIVGNIITMIRYIPILTAQMAQLASAQAAVAITGAAAFPWKTVAAIGAAAAVGVTIGAVVFGGGGGQQNFDQQWEAAGRYVKQRAYRERRRY